jgi:hypothetical protein
MSSLSAFILRLQKAEKRDFNAKSLPPKTKWLAERAFPSAKILFAENGKAAGFDWPMRPARPIAMAPRGAWPVFSS